MKGIAQRAPQAVVKITGGGKSAAAISAHLRYISRNGGLPLEDQDSRLFEGREGRADIIERWEHTGLPEESRFREAFNIVLSSTKGSDPAAVLRAARDFAKEQFGGQHDYAMVLHAPSTDPSPKRSENAHVHLVVKARSHDGKKLNPRKSDLFAYRQAYARHMRASGIHVIAVRREALFNTKGKREKQSVYQMKKRGALGPKVAKPDAAAKAVMREAVAREMYSDVVAALARSELPDDIAMSRALSDVIAQRVGPKQVLRPPRRSR